MTSPGRAFIDVDGYYCVDLDLSCWTLDEAVAVPAEADPGPHPGEGLPLPARLRRWVGAHTPAGVTATELRALLSEAADEIERLAEEQRKIMERLGQREVGRGSP